MFKRENLEDFEKTIEGEHYYVCAEVNKVMDRMEARLKELEVELKDILCVNASQARSANALRDSMEDRIKELEAILDIDPRTSVSLIDENKMLRERIKELEASHPKWISIKDDEKPEDRQEVLIESVKGVFLSKYLKGYKTCFYVPGLYNFTIKGVKNWMPLPPTPTTEKPTADEKEGK